MCRQQNTNSPKVEKQKRKNLSEQVNIISTHFNMQPTICSNFFDHQKPPSNQAFETTSTTTQKDKLFDRRILREWATTRRNRGNNQEFFLRLRRLLLHTHACARTHNAGAGVCACSAQTVSTYFQPGSLETSARAHLVAHASVRARARAYRLSQRAEHTCRHLLSVSRTISKKQATPTKQILCKSQPAAAAPPPLARSKSRGGEGQCAAAAFSLALCPVVNGIATDNAISYIKNTLQINCPPHTVPTRPFC